MTRDLHEPGDNGWTFELPAPDAVLPEFGTPAVVESDATAAADLVIVSYANGFYLSCQAQQLLAAQGIRARVLDIRYLVPLHADKIAAAIADCRKVLIVDECRKRGSLSEELFTALHEFKPNHYHISRLCAEDSFIPLGAAAYHVLPSKGAIVEAAQALVCETNAETKAEKAGAEK